MQCAQSEQSGGCTRGGGAGRGGGRQLLRSYEHARSVSKHMIYAPTHSNLGEGVVEVEEGGGLRGGFESSRKFMRVNSK
jgi:hypothetical protein